MTTNHPLFKRIRRHTNFATILRAAEPPVTVTGAPLPPGPVEGGSAGSQTTAVKALLVPNASDLPMGRVVQGWVSPTQVSPPAQSPEDVPTWEQPTVISRRSPPAVLDTGHSSTPAHAETVQRAPGTTDQGVTPQAAAPQQPELTSQDLPIEEKTDDPTWNRLQAIMNRHRDQTVEADQTLTTSETQSADSEPAASSMRIGDTLQKAAMSSDETFPQPDHALPEAPAQEEGSAVEPVELPPSGEPAVQKAPEAHTSAGGRAPAEPAPEEISTPPQQENDEDPHEAPTLGIQRPNLADLAPPVEDTDPDQRTDSGPHTLTPKEQDGEDSSKETVQQTVELPDPPGSFVETSPQDPAQKTAPSTEQFTETAPAGHAMSPPLQDAWPVQRREQAGESLTGAIAPERPAAQSPGISDDNPQVLELMRRPSSRESSASTIEVIPPRGPRPTLRAKTAPELVQRLRSGEEAPRQGPMPSAEPISDAVTQLEPASVKTDIGPLPADLWNLIGKEPPAAAGASETQTAHKTTTEPAAEAIQRAEAPPETTVSPRTIQAELGAEGPPGPQSGLDLTPRQTVLQLEPTEQRETESSAPSPETEQATEEAETQEVDIGALARLVLPEIKRRLALEKERLRN